MPRLWLALIHKWHLRRAIFLLALCLFPVVSFGQPQQILKQIDDKSYAAFTTRHNAHLDVRVDSAEELETSLRIYTGQIMADDFSASKYKIVKVDSKRALIPFNSLSSAFQRVFVKAAWPNDYFRDGIWHHEVVYRGHETLWSISEWFTGKGANYKLIKRKSGLRSDAIGRGTKLKIESSLLRESLRPEEIEITRPKEPVFAAQTPVQETEMVVEEDAPMATDPAKVAAPNKEQPKADTVVTPGAVTPVEPEPEVELEEPTQSSDGGDRTAISSQLQEITYWRNKLSYGEDFQGKYGQYRLQAGEAIYSSVVVRFTGLIRAEDVNQLAARIIRRNSIKDETDLAIGHPIRIPYEELQPEFKKADDPEFQVWRSNLEAVSNVAVNIQTRNLDGVHILLDAGHGGRDPGALKGHVWEDDYVYDIMCRIKYKLETETAAVVETTIIDPSVQYKVQNVKKFVRDHDETLLTSPRYSLNNSRVGTDGVNLRWHIANYRYDQWAARGVQPENMLFASFHADSIHHSLRGKMIYVPDARKYPRHVRPDRRFANYREYKMQDFRPSRSQMQRSQALSMKFADHVIQSTKRAGLRVHKDQPIRTVIYRNRYTVFVPAVLNYNRIPTRSLIEVCNLNNTKDRALLREPTYRQKVADAFVEAVLNFYGAGEKKVSFEAFINSSARASK